MKLPDFRTDASLTKLKIQLGIPANRFASFNPGIIDLTPDEEQSLKDGSGVDVDPDAIIFQSDSTFSFKGTRVAIYIRDISTYGRSEELPRYHIVQCRTIREKKENNTFNRYVVNCEPSGRFKVNVITDNRIKERFADLRVCQNCLAEMRFWGFSYDMEQNVKEAIVGDFTPKAFFEAFPMSLFDELPAYDVESYPANVYSSDFPIIAERLKVIRNFTCEDCGDFLKEQQFRRYLHVHHINSQKSDNRPTNLKVLCYECHAKYHSHMQNNSLANYRSLNPRPPKSPYWRRR